MAIVKNGLVGINNVLTVVFTTFYCCLLCFYHHKGVTGVFQKGNVQKSDGTGMPYRYVHTQAGNTAGKSGVAAETVELVLQLLGCFPIQGSVYSPFTLFEDQALKLLWGSSVVLSCSGLGPCFLAL